MKDYYLPRWELFFDYLQLELIDPGHFTYSQELFEETFLQEIVKKKTYFISKVIMFEYPHSKSLSKYSVTYLVPQTVCYRLVRAFETRV